MDVKFYKEKESGLVVFSLLPKEGDDNYIELKANSIDAATEKNVPVVSIEGNKVHVEVGSTIHPMTVEHHIAFIACVTDDVVQVKYLEKTGEPKADFELAEGEKVKAVYEYCNLHGLWVKEIA